jgi:D-arabinose 1-dehydrogenase-like Zn-dependent alcohol dehydrogenase
VPHRHPRREGRLANQSPHRHSPAGHEGVGIVTELAPGELAHRDLGHDVHIGDRVAMPWLGYACGTCDYCVSGWETLCHAQEMMGYTIDGGMGEYATAYTDYVVKVREGVDPFDAAPLTCAGVTTYKAVKLAGTRSSDFVAVFGVGGLGHLAIQYAAIAAGRVVAVDVIDEKLQLGAEFTINATKEDPVEAIQRLERYQRTKRRLGRQRGAEVAQIELARKLTEAIWYILTRNEPFKPFAPEGAISRLTA